MNSSGRRILLTLFLSLIFSFAETAAQTNPLFWLGDDAQSAEEFLYAYGKSRQAAGENAGGGDLKEYFDLYVRFKLKVKEAKERGYHESPSFKDEMAGYRVQLAKPYLTESKVSEELVNEAYLRTLEEVEASHILLEIPPNASPADTLRLWNNLLDIKKRVEQGESFAALAKQESQDPSAQQNGGYLGYFSAFQMVFPFENAAYNTPTAQVSEPFRSSFGYHIVYVHNRRKSSGSFRLAHIFLKNHPEDSSAAYKRAVEIKQRLDSGEDWDELVSMFSDEATNKGKGGELPWLTLRQLPPSFSEEIAKMGTPDKISPPLKTDAGWHLIKLLEKKPVPPLDEVREIIEARISKDERAQKKNERASEALIQKLGVQIDENVLHKALQVSGDSLRQGSWSYDPSQPFVKNKLLTNADTVIVVENLYGYMVNNQRKKADATAGILWNEFLFQVLEDLEIKNLKKTNSNYRYLLNEYYEGTLLFEIMNEKVWQYANKDTLGLQQFFENNRPKYRWQERASATIIKTSPDLLSFIASTSPDGSYLLHREETGQIDLLPVLIKSIDQKLASRAVPKNSILLLVRGDEVLIKQSLAGVLERLTYQVEIVDEASEDFELEWLTDSEIALEKYYNHPDPLSLKVSSGVFEKEDGTVPEKFWKPGFHREPSGSLETGYFVHEILPSQEKSLDEIRGKVVSDYQEHLESEWIVELEKKYPLKVNTKAWKNVVKTLED